MNLLLVCLGCSHFVKGGRNACEKCIASITAESHAAFPLLRKLAIMFMRTFAYLQLEVKRKIAVDDLWICLNYGEVFGLSTQWRRKSTLLHMLSGLLSPTDGVAMVVDSM